MTNGNNLEQLAAGLAQDQEQTQQQPKDLESLATNIAQQQVPIPVQPPTVSQRVQDILATPGEALVEAGQRLGQLEQAIPGVMPLARKIASLLPKSVQRGTGLPPGVRQRLATVLQQKQDILPQATPVARTGGKLLGDVTALELTGGAIAPALGVAKIPELLGRPAAQALGGVLTSPTHPLFGAITAGVGGTALEALKGLKFLPKMTLGGLGKATSRSFENMKSIGKRLYDQTFEGVGHIKVQLADEAQSAIDDLKDVLSKTSPTRKAIDNFEKNPTLRGMHDLKSSIGEKESSNVATIRKSGMNPVIEDEQPALTSARKTMAKNTRDYLGIISPEKQSLYDQAQAHWRQNVVPFREFPIIRTLTGPRRIAKPGLFKEFAEKIIPEEAKLGKIPREPPTEALRRIVGVPRGVAQTGRLLHHKVGGIPLGAWLGVGGLGAVGGGDILRRHLGI